jgi:leucyl/phenylalanyl-tRNA--protein transferase
MSARFGTNDLLACYRRGVFPMGDARDDPNLFLVDPDMRGILPLDDFHIPKRLKRG